MEGGRRHTHAYARTGTHTLAHAHTHTLAHAHTHTRTRTHTHAHTCNINAIVPRFAFVPIDNKVRVVALRTGATVRTLSGHEAAITQVTLNPANRLQVITSSRDGTIKVWDYDEAVCLRTFRADAPVLAFFVDGHDGRELFWVEAAGKSSSSPSSSSSSRPSKTSKPVAQSVTCVFRHHTLPDPSQTLNVDIRGVFACACACVRVCVCVARHWGLAFSLPLSATPPPHFFVFGLSHHVSGAREVLSGENGTAWGYHARTKSLIFARGKDIHIVAVQSGVRRKLRSNNDVTVIATHPQTDDIATGDVQGKITIW